MKVWTTCAAALLAGALGVSCGDDDMSNGAHDAAARDGAALADAGAGGNGNLHIIAIDDDTDQPAPARVELSQNGVPRPLMFSNDIVGVPLGRDTAGQLGSICLLTGDGEARIKAGRYDLTVQRGIEYDVVQTRADVPATGTAEVRVRLPRAFQTQGWVGGDFHVHQVPSNDSDVPAQDRVVSMVVEGVELVVASDHNENFDLAGAVGELLGMGRWIYGISGNEITLNLGHWNVFPVPYDPRLPRGGGPVVNLDWDVTTALTAFRTSPAGDRIVQLNHPRLLPPLGYFWAAGWDPVAGTVAAPPFVLDYDSIEIMNGIEAKRDDIEMILRDWLGLLERGYVLTPVGNSDTHKIASAKSGSPRTFLRVPDDRPAMLTYEAVRDAIRGHHAIATSGPWVDVSINDTAGPGDTAVVPGGDMRIDLTVSAANFVPVDRIRIFANGNNLLLTRAVPNNINHQRYHEVITMPAPAVDTFYVVVADAATPLPRELAGRLDRDTFSYAIVSPIFVDVGAAGFQFPKPRLPQTLLSGRVNVEALQQKWWQDYDTANLNDEGLPPKPDLDELPP